jgi:replicative DNA helicase
MSGSGDRGSNREQEISTISRNLKALAKDLNIPIIALSQLSRAVETRKESKVPQLSDLRESGAIEQDADMVMFIYRPEYYENFSNENGESTRGETHIKIAKHRNGSLDSVKLRALLHIQKFEEWDDDSGPALTSGGNWRPVNTPPSQEGSDDSNSRLFIQKGSRMNDFDDAEDETPF